MPKKPKPKKPSATLSFKESLCKRRASLGGRTVMRLWSAPKCQAGSYLLFRTSTVGEKAIIAKGFHLGREKKYKTIKQAWNDSVECFYIYYPKPLESLMFADSLVHLREKGLADKFPGSVGVVRVFKCSLVRSPEGKLSFPILSTPSVLFVSAIQGSYIQRKTQSLSRSLVSKHGGWREHLLDKVFQDAILHGLDIVVFKPPDLVQAEDSKRVTIQTSIFIKAAGKHGFKSVKKEDGVVFVKK